MKERHAYAEQESTFASETWERNRASTVDLLNTLLCDEVVLYTKTRNYHWNVQDSRFHDLHKFFEEQYEQLDDIIDDVAERARAVGGKACGRLSEFLEGARLKESDEEWPDGQTMIARLLSDHEAVAARLRQDIETCQERFKDESTANFLTELLGKHEKTAWMLRATLQSAPPSGGESASRKVRELMTRDVETVSPGMSARDVAAKMERSDLGCFPVAEDGKVVGMITDRDLCVRVLAKGLDPAATAVREVMSTKVVMCSEDVPVEEAEAAMKERQIRRLPIVDREGKLSGLFTIGKVAKAESGAKAGDLLRGIVQPS